MRKIQVGNIAETVVERSDYPMDRVREILKNETVAVIGYGVQGRSQSLNMRDNGVRVIVGLRPGGRSWDLAQQDGWKAGEALFDLPEAVDKGTIIQYLLSDAGQKEQWPTLKHHLKAGDALYFSHGFSIVYRDQTGVVPPPNVDVILVAPKGSGTMVRRHFLEGKGINASYAIHQDYTGRALERCLATGTAIGSGYMFETTFEKEVHSDLTGERGVLMGAIYGLWLAQYEVLREHGHSPTEAFNETVEEATQSLYPLIGENGMDWMYANCSATAQRGALDWRPRFKKAVLPVFKELYQRVKTGKECARVLSACGAPNYQVQLQKELNQIRDSEMWRAGAAVRALRPKEAAKLINKSTKGVAGRQSN
jgi:ketol-acid reductoisomerase